LKENLKQFLQNTAARLYGSRRKLATFGVGLLACFLAYHVVFGANGLVVYKQKREEYRQLQQQNRALEQQNLELERQNKALKTDPQAIEKEARQQLHYARPGDVVYTVPSKPNVTQPPHK